MTTRLNKDGIDKSVTSLRELLNNIVGFVECPIKDRDTILDLWHGRFPQDLIKSMETLGKFNLTIRSSDVVTDKLRIATWIGDQSYTAMINLEEATPYSAEKATSGILQFGTCLMPILCGDKDFYCDVYFGRRDAPRATMASAQRMDPGYIRDKLGQDQADAFFDWIRNCAIMYDELIIANKTITDIFGMAKTAGQIKRMVPDLLKYLPAAQQAAYENQIRASTLPFEWAPYPKSNVDIMLAQIDKGHLLQGMRKEKRKNCSVEMLDYSAWATRCSIK